MLTPPFPSPFQPLSLRLGASGIDRQGCFAITGIPAGARIIEYIGERIGPDEARRREADPARPGVYTFWLDQERIIDGWVGGNESIYLNHSCDPNCSCAQEGDRVFFVARRDIPAGEELTIDYAYDPQTPLEPCRCGSPRCRGYLNAVNG